MLYFFFHFSICAFVHVRGVVTKLVILTDKEVCMSGLLSDDALPVSGSVF